MAAAAPIAQGISSAGTAASGISQLTGGGQAPQLGPAQQIQQAANPIGVSNQPIQTPRVAQSTQIAPAPNLAEILRLFSLGGK